MDKLIIMDYSYGEVYITDCLPEYLTEDGDLDISIAIEIINEENGLDLSPRNCEWMVTQERNMLNIL